VAPQDLVGQDAGAGNAKSPARALSR